MNALVIYSRSKPDTRLLRDSFRKVVGFRVEDAWSIRQAITEEELKTVLADGAAAQICCTDITGKEGVGVAEAARRLWKKAQLVLIVTPCMSPINYIRPGLMPAGVLMKPLSAETIQPLLDELVRMIQQKGRRETFSGAMFSVVSHGTTYRVPLEDILYVEARNKKLYLYTANSEIEFYDTLEHILERMPEQFIRCHKSFVVNSTAIEQISLAQNILSMSGGRVQIPISRSYKAQLREAIR